MNYELQMPQLEAKLSAELSEEGVIIACRFPFPDWPVDKVVGSGIDSVWMYTKKGLANSQHLVTPRKS